MTNNGLNYIYLRSMVALIGVVWDKVHKVVEPMSDPRTSVRFLSINLTNLEDYAKLLF